MDFEKVRKFQEICGLSPTPSKNDQDECDQHLRPSCEEKSCTSEDAELRKRRMDYQVNNYFLHYMFLFGSLVGTEIFYISALPFVFWNLDIYIARMAVTVWVVTMYLGQAAKDILRWPRPTWPVFKLETRVEAEYGLPSTHAIAATAFPFTMLIAAFGRYEFNIFIGVFLACAWCGLVSLSRMYVGMHSILDVMAGIALAASYLYFGWPFMEMVNDYTLHSKYAPYIIIVSHFILAIVYPNPDRWSTSRGDTVIILGVGAGVHCATWFGSYYGFDWDATGDLPQQLILPSLSDARVALIRYAIGMALILSVRFVAKYASLVVICHAASISTKDKLSRRRTEVEVPYKFFTYACVGFCTNFIVPLLLERLGIVF